MANKEPGHGLLPKMVVTNEPAHFECGALLRKVFE